MKKKRNNIEIKAVQIAELIMARRDQEAILRIQQSSMPILNAVFKYQSIKTTLLCQAVIAKSRPVVEALLAREINTNPDLDTRGIFYQIIADPGFDRDSIPLCQLLFQHGTKTTVTRLDDREQSQLLADLTVMGYKFFGTEDIAIHIQKHQVLVALMGDDYFRHMLMQADKSAVNVLTDIAAQSKHLKNDTLYHFVLERMFEYIRKNQIAGEQLSIFLASSNFDSKLKQWLEKENISWRTRGPVAIPYEQQQALLYTRLQSTDHVLIQDYGWRLDFPFYHESVKNSVMCNDPMTYDTLLAIQAGIAFGDKVGPGAARFGLNFEQAADGMFEIAEGELEKHWFRMRKTSSDFYFWYVFTEPKKENMQAVLDEYHDDMSKTTSREERFKRIIKFASDVSRIHYFQDANKRTAYTVLNVELIKHDFHPVILDNIGDLRHHSQETLYFEVLNGIEKCRRHFESINTMHRKHFPLTYGWTMAKATLHYSSRMLNNTARSLQNELYTPRSRSHTVSESDKWLRKTLNAGIKK